MAEAKSKIQEKALVDNLSAMRSERDGLAELTSKLEKKKERPAGVDASGVFLLFFGNAHSNVIKERSSLCCHSHPRAVNMATKLCRSCVMLPC